MSLPMSTWRTNLYISVTTDIPMFQEDYYGKDEQISSGTATSGYGVFFDDRYINGSSDDRGLLRFLSGDVGNTNGLV